MPYLGNVPAEAYTNTVKDSFNGDGSTTAFTLSQPSTTNNLRVVVENVIQDPTVAYSVSGTTLTFTSAPPSGTANIYAVHLGPATMTAVPPAEITSATNFTDGITVDKNGGTVITADRASSDGTIIDLQKSGTTVGIIGANGGRVYTSGPSYGAKFGNVSLDPCTSTGSTADNAYDLGGSSVRWKDLYLSGGLPGTAGGTLVINENSVNYDFRVEGDANSQALFVDASDNFVKSGVAHYVGNYSTGLYASGEGVGLYTADAYSSCGAHIEIGTNAADGWACIYLNRVWGSGNDQRMIQFGVNGTTAGTITSNATTTSYATSSDYRLKENVVELTGATDRLKQIPVHRFNFIADPDTTVDGFLAHEVQAIVPEAVTGEKDAVDGDGNIIPQGIDQSKLVPLLTAALQEAITKIETLEVRIAALENA